MLLKEDISMHEKIMTLIQQTNYDVGFYASDMKGNEIKYNESRLFESASCIKLFILIEYFKQVYEKKISISDIFSYDEIDHIPGLDAGVISKLQYGLKLTSLDYATLMIIYSDNIATNKLIDYLGIENINHTIKELGFQNTVLFHKLNLLKYFKFGQTTPYDYAKAYQMILNGEMINEEVSKNILNILKKQQYNNMLVKGLPQVDVLLRGTDESVIKYIAFKSGAIIYTGEEMKNLRNDGGIISTNYGDYVVAIFVSDIDDLQDNYDNAGIELGSKINKIIFDEFIKNNGSLQ